MRGFKKNILRTNYVEDVIPPVSFQYNILKGNIACSGGYIDISGTSTLSVYSTIQRSSWVVGTELFLDEFLTIPVPNNYIKSVTGGTVDLFFADIVSGEIVNIYPPMTPC